MSAPATVVLGIDGLDYELCEEWGLLDSLGSYHTRIETIDNPVKETPHTRELWPTIITGRPPRDHGLRAADEDGTVGWNNPLLAVGSSLAAKTLPQRIRTALGKRLRQRGAGLEQQSPTYYTEHDLTTVFDDRRSLPVSIPNYYTEIDRLFGLTSDRAELWDAILRDKDSSGYTSALPVHRLTERLCTAAGSRLGVLEAALERAYDLVFAWFGFIDTVGHLAPPIGQDWQRAQYGRVAQWIDRIRLQTPSETTLLVVSDHGLRDGSHTHDAVLGGDEEAVLAADDVTEVRSVIDAVTPPERNSLGDLSETHDQLADLGYLQGGGA